MSSQLLLPNNGDQELNSRKPHNIYSILLDV